MKRIVSGKYTRINAIKAKHLFEQGHPIWVVPYKVNPNNVWGIGSYLIPINGHTWEQQLNEWTYYWDQHLNKQNGQYLAYYVETEVLEK